MDKLKQKLEAMSRDSLVGMGALYDMFTADEIKETLKDADILKFKIKVILSAVNAKEVTAAEGITLINDVIYEGN